MLIRARYFHPSVAMILGFVERRQTVSEEAYIPPGEGFINLDILITSLRTSEIGYPVGVRSVIEGQPIIEPSNDIQNPMYDGIFGNREEGTINNLVFMEVLRANTTMLPTLEVDIRDDLIFEEEECFELSIFQVNPGFFTENFVCNRAGAEFLCQHEICITDDDG